MAYVVTIGNGTLDWTHREFPFRKEAEEYLARELDRSRTDNEYVVFGLYECELLETRQSLPRQG